MTARPPLRRSQDARDYLVLLGYHKLHEATPHSLRVAVDRLIVHRGFNKTHFMGSDLALLQLRQPVAFTPHVLPACLPGPDTSLPTYTPCWVTGWGMLTEHGERGRPWAEGAVRREGGTATRVGPLWACL